MVPCTVRISRQKVYRSRFATGYGPAWKWYYDVFRPDGGGIVLGADLLSIARRRAKEYAKANGCVIVESWKAR